MHAIRVRRLHMRNPHKEVNDVVVTRKWIGGFPVCCYFVILFSMYYCKAHMRICVVSTSLRICNGLRNFPQRQVGTRMGHIQ